MFAFAASEPIRVGTYAVKKDGERALYDLRLRDFGQQREGPRDFLRG